MNIRNPYLIATCASLGLLAVGVSVFLKSSDQNLFATEESAHIADKKNVNNHSLFSQEPSFSGTTKKPVAAAKKLNTNFNAIQERLDIMQERRPNMSYEPSEVAEAITRTDAWSPATEIPKSLPLTPEEFADGREFIHFDSLKIETLVPGDNLKLALSDTGQEYDVNIDDVEVIDPDRTTWRGHIVGTDGNHYEVSFTRGKSLTVGGIDTPDGNYVIQAHGNKGWVASSELLFKNHMDPIDPKDEIAVDGHMHEHEHAHAHTN
jgi:hypothetical protein